MTLLFTDLVASTELLVKLGDDEADRVRRDHFDVMRGAIRAHEGREVKTIGDSFMVAFASTLQAIECAISMQQGTHRANSSVEESERLQLRIGLEVGEATHEDGDYFGTSVVIAKRLCDLAGGGQVLVSQLMRRLVGSRGTFTFRELEPRAVKGIADAFALCEVMWEPAERPVEESEDADFAGAAAPLPPLIASGETTAFFGRDSELRELQSCWERARSGERRLFLLAGEPGIGKTRLAAHFGRLAHADGAAVLYGQCFEEAILPYQPFVEALRHYVLSSSSARLRVQVGANGPVLARLIPELAQQLPDLLSSALPTRSLPNPVQDDPQGERYRFFDAIAAMLVEISQERPLVLILDDLHWADTPTLQVLKHFMRAPEDVPVLLLGTYRQGELERSHPLAGILADLRRDRGFSRSLLEGLSGGDIKAMIANWASGEVTGAVVDEISARTEGNPFFIQEVLANLRETNANGGKEGRRASRLATSIEEHSIPESIKEVIGRRLSRLSESCNAVFAVASVIGREFEFTVLERVSGLATELLLDALDEAIAAGVLSELPQRSGAFMFAHPLTREILYGELTTARRIRMHRQVGEALEALAGNNQDAYISQLAHHFFEASWGRGDVDKAVTYSRRAGDRALALFAYEDATEHYRRALEALALQPDPSGGTHCDLLLALGEANERAGEREQAIANLHEAAAVARRLQDGERLGRVALSFRGTTVVDPIRVDLLEEALAALGEQDSALRARLLGELSRTLHFSESRERRTVLARQAVEVARRIGDPAALAHALHASYFARAGPEDVEHRLGIVTEFVRIAHEIDDRDLALAGHFWRIVDSLELGDIEAADSDIAEYSLMAVESQQPFHLWRMMRLRTMRAMLKGAFEEGERLAREALAIGQQIHEPYASIDFGVQFGTIRREQGRLQEVEASISSLAERYPELPAWRCALAMLHAEMGREAAARTELERLAANGFSDLPQDLLWPIAVTLLCEASAKLHDSNSAKGLYGLMLPHANRCVVVGDAVACYGSAARYLALLATTLGRWDEAANHFEKALQMNAKIGAWALLAHTQLEYGRMLMSAPAPWTNKPSSTYKERPGQLFDSAAATFRELGMPTYLQEADELRELPPVPL